MLMIANSPYTLLGIMPTLSAAKKRVRQFPNLPTIAETVPGYEASVAFGLFAAAGTPTNVINKVPLC
jgi:tripartite-type tricarboxylate transporter receptor subunit TctC